jgi:hypothetical protein
VSVVHPTADLAAQISRHNQRLAAAGESLRLERRGGRLGLRGPLPPRQQEAAPGPWTVRRLSLGLPASEEGLQRALAELARVRQELRTGRFSWRTGAQADPAGEELQASLAGFETAFFADPRRRRRPAGSRSTWRASYRPYLRRLEALAAARNHRGAPDLGLIEAVLESYPLASRSRQQCGTALAGLARHLGLDLPSDWGERGAGYGLHTARFRQLPGDGEILDLVQRIPNPAWRLVYGLMATYGLRNHEAFFCDCSALAPGGDRVLRVLPTSKTGEHQVWPFQPEWVERFGLERLGRDRAALPPVGTDLRRTTLRQVGRRVAEQFRRYDLPITPYDLRHAWAVRTIHIGLPDTVAARMMGHSVAIHTRTYHHWITRRDQQRAVDAALARRDAGRASATPPEWGDPPRVP